MTLKTDLIEIYLDAKSEFSTFSIFPYASQFPFDEPQETANIVKNAQINVKAKNFFIVLVFSF